MQECVVKDGSETAKALPVGKAGEKATYGKVEGVQGNGKGKKGVRLNCARLKMAR